MTAGRLFGIPGAATANAQDAVTVLVVQVVAVDVCQKSGVIVFVQSHV